MQYLMAVINFLITCYLSLIGKVSKSLTTSMTSAFEIFTLGFVIATGVVVLLLLVGLFQWLDSLKRLGK